LPLFAAVIVWPSILVKNRRTILGALHNGRKGHSERADGVLSADGAQDRTSMLRAGLWRRSALPQNRLR